MEFKIEITDLDLMIRDIICRVLDERPEPKYCDCITELGYNTQVRLKKGGWKDWSSKTILTFCPKCGKRL